MKLKVKNIYFFSVPFGRSISNLNINLSRHVVVTISNGSKEGIGEGVLYRGTSLNAIFLYKEIFKPFIEDNKFISLESARNEIFKELAHINPGITSAFDLALWDLEAKVKNMSLHQLLKATKNKLFITEEMFLDNLNREHLSEINKHGTRHLKIKIEQETINNWQNINQVLNNFRGEVRTDANRAFSLKDFSKFRLVLRKLKINEIEEPLKENDIMKLEDKSGIILDESVLSLDDLKKYLKNGFKMFNLKFSRLGGITACRKYQKEIEKWGGQIVIGCSEELGIATHAQLVFAASITSLHSIEGLGSERLKFDIIKKPYSIKNGKVSLNSKVKFSEKRLIDASRKFHFPVSVNAKLSPAFVLFEIRENIKGKLKNLWLRVN